MNNDDMTLWLQLHGGNPGPACRWDVIPVRRIPCTFEWGRMGIHSVDRPEFGPIPKPRRRTFWEVITGVPKPPAAWSQAWVSVWTQEKGGDPLFWASINTTATIRVGDKILVTGLTLNLTQ